MEEAFDDYIDIVAEKHDRCPYCIGSDAESINNCLTNPGSDNSGQGVCKLQYFRITTNGVVDEVSINRSKEKGTFEPLFQRQSVEACSDGDFCNSKAAETTTRYYSKSYKIERTRLGINLFT